MLKDESEIALNEVLIACRKVADFSNQAEELTKDPELADFFRRLSRRRRTDADRIVEIERGLGYMPDEPNRDKQDFSRLFTLARTAMADEPARILVEKAVNLETELEEEVNEALLNQWSDTVEAFLWDIQRSSRKYRYEILQKRIK